MVFALYIDPSHCLCLNTENRLITFKANYFGTMALTQDIHINMPFQSWEFRPHSTNSAIFTIIAAIVEVEIEIKVSLLLSDLTKRVM